MCPYTVSYVRHTPKIHNSVERVLAIVPAFRSKPASVRAATTSKVSDMRLGASAVLLVISASAGPLSAQRQPPVRPLGPVMEVSPRGILSSVSYVRALPDGRVLVSDVVRGQGVLLDAKLAKVKAVIDSTTEFAINAFTPRGALFAFRGDSSLYVDVKSLSMLVLDGKGDIVRAMALPGNEYIGLQGGPFGTPGYDPRGRIVFRKGFAESYREETEATTRIRYADTIPIYRVSLTTRERETLAYVRAPTTSILVVKDQSGDVKSTTASLNPFAIVDDWALLPSGRLAVLRGKDYHVDWLEVDGRWVSSARIPFLWERLDDDAKLRVVDSVNVHFDSVGNAAEERRRNAIARGEVILRPGESVPTSRTQMIPPSELADYRPAFRQGAIRVDTEGNLWVRTTMPSTTGPIYDIIDSKGELVDRVQLPFGRVISGFGPGVLYMGVLDGAEARLERARLR